MPLGSKVPVGVSSESDEDGMAPASTDKAPASGSAEADAAPERNACVRGSEALDAFLQRSFYRLGLYVGTNPGYTLMGSLFVGLAIAALASQIETESECGIWRAPRTRHTA